MLSWSRNSIKITQVRTYLCLTEYCKNPSSINDPPPTFLWFSRETVGQLTVYSNKVMSFCISTLGHHFVFYPSFGEIVCTSSSKSAVLKYVCNDGSSEDRTLQHLDSTTFTSSKLHHCMVQSSCETKQKQKKCKEKRERNTYNLYSCLMFMFK